MRQDNNISFAGNNTITIIGRIASNAVFSHEVFGEGFYNFSVDVERLSDTCDTLPITISERIFDRYKFAVGEMVSIVGQIRSYNSFIEAENRNRLVLTIFVRDFEFLDDDNGKFGLVSMMDDDVPDIFDTDGGKRFGRSPNDVCLNGYICKPPIYRTTPFGREIADILIAVNRSYNKSDYIPCITWGRNARYTSRLAVGDNIRVWGRMQSRIYQKRKDDGSAVDKTAYEVSISKLEISEEVESALRA